MTKPSSYNPQTKTYTVRRKDGTTTEVSETRVRVTGIALACLGLLFVGSCVYSMATNHDTGPDYAAIDSARDAVRAQLRDPSSAQFSGVTSCSGGARGFVNAKNGFGGYTGDERFVVQNGVAYLESGTPADEFQHQLNSCI